MKTLRSIGDAESYPADGTVAHAVIETPAGPVTISADAAHVVGIRFGAYPPAPAPRPRLLREAVRQLSEYFAGKRRAFDLPLRLLAPRFTADVLREVDAIPFGETRSYSEIAARLRRPRAARAVGRAVGSNPLPIVIPCHRVLAAGGRLGGFGGGLSWKCFLLAREGAGVRGAIAASRG
jgi:methylated-DNA-[protein]-cysteine S-methyltransferase